ncbi:tripartite tricarboxylate transporter substrate-binding protein [Streptomyces sp. NPDC052309]|uniref:Bug family tripartite tricarboxylate transporter substrate binding protein n=1 Tax=Streptomyces sp. NPDC052309 TaxID=3155421 RepID=UPI00341B6CCD
MRLLPALAAGAAAMLALTGCANASAGDGNTVSLAGRTIELIVPFAPGGGYDSYARQLAPKLGEELDATVIVVNKPGAGGVLATNELSKAEPDGTTLALFNMPGHIGSALAGAPGVQYDVNSFSYIGRLSSEPDVVLTSEKGDIDTWSDVMKEKDQDPTRFAATGPGSNEYMDGVVLHSLLGLDSKVITGYSTSNEAYLGVLSGVVDLHSRSYGSQESALKSGDAVPLLTIGSKQGKKLLADTPVLADIVPPEKAELARSHTALVESGRAIAGPPGMKPEQLELVRDAFRKVVTDPEYAAAAEESRRPISFATGQEVADNVAALMRSPKAYVDLLEEAYGV